MKILTAMLVVAGLAIAGANVYAGSNCGYSKAKSADKAACGVSAKSKDCSKPKDCGDKASSDATVAQAEDAKSSDS